jgi:hypothetical protein
LPEIQLRTREDAKRKAVGPECRISEYSAEGQPVKVALQEERGKPVGAFLLANQ